MENTRGGLWGCLLMDEETTQAVFTMSQGSVLLTLVKDQRQTPRLKTESARTRGYNMPRSGLCISPALMDKYLPLILLSSSSRYAQTRPCMVD